MYMSDAFESMLFGQSKTYSTNTEVHLELILFGES